MFARTELPTVSGSSSSRIFILFMSLLLSGWRTSLKGTRANTISEALATTVYHSSTTSMRHSIHDRHKHSFGLGHQQHHRLLKIKDSFHPWTITSLRGGADATAKTSAVNPLFSVRDTVEESGQGFDHQEKDEDMVSDDEHLSSRSLNGRIMDSITTSIVIRDRVNGSSVNPVNESIHVFTDKKLYNQVHVPAQIQDGKNQEQDPIIPCTYIAETNLPTDIGMFRLRAYRVNNDIDFLKLEKNKFFGTEPCVIYSSDKSPFGMNAQTSLEDAIPVRIHDQCVTSEVFRSKRCDCSDQLKMALKYIQEHGGAIIYLQQEGRGIGLANKVAAYALQDHGMDTVDANIHLGFPEDCRQYGVVPSILQDMGIKKVNLMTNNPRKVDRLKALGVDVVTTIPMVVANSNPYNFKYLQTKKDRMNHANFGDMLLDSSDVPTDGFLENTSNDVLKPRKPHKNAAENFISEGEEMAAAAVVAALDDESMVGVTAADDGYCFGRKSVEDAIDAVRRGELVVVVDDMNRENEGDFIMAADLATPDTIATIVRYSSGVICVAMEGKRMDELNLPAMVQNNEDPKGTAFSVTVDAAKYHGISTGISAKDRAKTLTLLADPSTKMDDFLRPGHIFPLRAREGGVLVRDGHTEAAVDLARMAGCNPCGVLCEIVSEENPVEMARLPELKKFCKKHGYILTSIVDIAQYRRDNERR